MHMGVAQVPLWQYGMEPVHAWPQVPQLRMSFWAFTQVWPQQMKPGMHCAGQLPPELVDEVELPVVVVPDDALVVEAPPVEVVEVPLAEAVEPLELCPVVVAPPTPVLVETFPPQAITQGATRASIARMP
jgi:hypothetical protein